MFFASMKLEYAEPYGFWGDEDGLFFEIELLAADGLELPVVALFDTGFSGWLRIKFIARTSAIWQKILRLPKNSQN
jgi:hypothetical protein